MKHHMLHNQKGSSLIGALLAMMVLGFTGMAVVETSTSANLTSVNEIQSNQALYIGNAGIEQAKDKLNQGLSPDVANQAFGMGNFTIVSNPSSSSFQVTGQVGSARKVQTIGTNFSNNCVALDLTEAYVEGTHLVNARLIKFCNAAAIVTGMRIDWDLGDCESDADAATDCVPGTYGDYDADDNAAQDEADDESYDDVLDNSGLAIGYAAYEDPDHEGKILICHVPPGNPANAHTLSVSVAGWEHGHGRGNGKLHNMDSLGACDGYQGEIQNDDESDDNGSDDVDNDDENICNATELSIYQCSNDIADQRNHGGAHVVSIGLAGNTIYDPSVNMGTPVLPGADGAETIDTDDMTLISDGTYLFTGPGETPTQYITFDTTLQNGKWYEVTVTFADGSELTQSFVAEAQASSEDTSDDDASPSEETLPPDPGFEVEDGTVTADADAEMTLDVLGSQITYGAGGPEVPVQVELGIVQSNGNISWSNLFSKKDVDGGESYNAQSTVTATSYIVRAYAKYKSYSALYDSTNQNQVKTLVNGDTAPPLAGFGGQKPVTEFLQPYLDGQGKIVLAYNQVIMLFELGVNMSQDPTNIAADFQDLVVLLTFASQSTDSNGVYYKQVGDQLRFLEKTK